MAQLSVKYFSQALNRNIRFEMYIPNDKPEIGRASCRERV